MRRPIFAFGIEEQCLTDEAAEPGAKTISVSAGCAQAFSAGDRLLAASGPNAQYLGAASSIGASSISFVHPLTQALPAGSALWRPASVFEWPNEPALPVKRRFLSGVRRERSLGGTLFATRVAKPQRIDQLHAACLPREAMDALREWIDSAIQGGLLAFTYVDEAGVPHAACLLSPELEVVHTDEQWAEAALELAIAAEGGFAP